MGKSARGLAQSKTLREVLDRTKIRQVLDCAESSGAFHSTSPWREKWSHIRGRLNYRCPTGRDATNSPVATLAYCGNFRVGMG